MSLPCSDDSIEELFAPQSQGGRPSSTPVRVSLFI